MKRLGLLVCDEHHPDLLASLGTYDLDFKNMIESVAPGEWEYSVWHCQAQELPLSPDDCDAWIISGSKAAAYEKDSWIEALKGFIRQLDQAEIRVLGICFGHQMIHSALGGDVEKYFDGWGLGAYPVTLTEDIGSFKAKDEVRVLAMHQDQVLTCAADFSVIGGSTFCQNAMTRKGNSILTLQAHPEFSDELFSNICQRIRDKTGHQLADSALAELGKPNDKMAMRELIAAFLTGNVT